MLDKLVSFFLISAVIGVAISYSKIYLFHLSSIALFGYLALNFKKFNIKEKISSNFRYLSFFIFFIMWYFISLLWTISPLSYAFQYLSYILMGISIIVVMVVYTDSQIKLNKIITALSIVFIAEIVLSLMELHPGFILPIAPSSTIVEYFGRQMASNNPTIPTGFNWNQNNFAVVMLMILPFILFHKNLLFKIILTLCIFVLIYKTNSRGGILALVVIFTLYCLIDKKRFLYFITCIFIISIIVFNSPYKQIVASKVTYLYDTAKSFVYDRKKATGAILIRHKLIDNGLKALNESYYFGVGVGGSLEVQKRLGGVYKNLGEKDFEYYVQKDTPTYNMHSFLVELLVDGGIIFFSIFTIWYIYVLKKLYNIVYNGNELLKYYAKASLLSMIAFIFSTVTPSSMIYMLPMWILFGLVMSVIKIGDKEINENINTI